MSLASWLIIVLMLGVFVSLLIAVVFADRLRETRQENERLRSLLKALGCSEYPIIRLVPLDARERAKLRG